MQAIVKTFCDWPLWWCLPVLFTFPLYNLHPFLTCSSVQNQLVLLNKLFLCIHIQHVLLKFLSPYFLLNMFLLPIYCEEERIFPLCILNPQPLWYIFLAVIYLLSLSMSLNVLPCYSFHIASSQIAQWHLCNHPPLMINSTLLTQVYGLIPLHTSNPIIICSLCVDGFHILQFHKYLLNIFIYLCPDYL